jgi:hypothetical protein
MRVQPEGSALLREARRELLETLLPHLPEAQRYTARMVANAMAIAARELGAPAWDERADAAKLAAQIRAGACDAPAHRADVLQRLREITRRRLEVSNPRVLEGARP